MMDAATIKRRRRLFFSMIGGGSGGGGPPNMQILGTPLRGYTLSVVGDRSLPGSWQARTAPAGTFADVTLANPFTIGNGTGGTGAAGREYRYRVTFKGVDCFSPPAGPTGISDSILPTSSAFATTGQDIANVNTDGVGVNGGLVRGVDYFNSINYYADDMGANAQMNYKWPVVGTGNVKLYMAFVRNNYDGGVPAVAPSAAIRQDNIGSMAFLWNLTETPGSSPDKTHLIEYYSTNDPASTANINKTNEFGVLPTLAPAARTYFNGGTGLQVGTYTDENALNWQVCSMPPPPSITAPGGRYVVAIEPSGTARLSGSFRIDRYVNWLIAQNIAKSADYFPGIASGIEVLSGQGSLSGKFMPSPAEMPWNPAAAYTFDADVAAYFARFTNQPGIDVRKALDVFVRALKTNSLYTLLDDFNPMWIAGKADMRRAFKSAAHDIVDRTGAASYVPGKGLTYAGAGYGGTGFNPATAGGQFAQDSAFLFAFLEADAGAVTAKFMGNATANMGRNTAGTSISHQLNNASSTIAGNYSAGQGFSVRRVAGAAPGGTGGSAGYQVKRSGSTTAVADPVATSTALTSAELEVGRAGSGTVYSSAVMSMIAYGGGMTNTQVDTFNSLVVAMRTAAKAAGV